MTLTAMVILERCRRAEVEKRRLREKVAMYRDAGGHMTASLDGIGARSTGETDHMANMAAKIDAAERELKQRDREYAAEMGAACCLLEMLPDPECGIMSRYYVRGQSLRAIAEGLGYSYNYVRHCKTDAAKRLRQLGEDDIKRLLPEWYVAEDERQQKRQR